ncbi:MAG: D-alanyl-D-alanine carboxypeptidase/D-alanyl-D-alanine-endopeptidase [Longimicrobiales bacterium]
MRARHYTALLTLGAAGTLAAWVSGSRPAYATAQQGNSSLDAAGYNAPATTGTTSAISPAVAALQTDLERLVNSANWPADRWSVMVVSLDRGDTLFSHGAGDLLAPASNIKVFTTAAALYFLGSEFRYNTFLMSTGPIENGVLKGDLVLYGTGDPTFTNRFGFQARSGLEALADTLALLGVKSIEGSVVGDGSYFSGPGTGEGWKPAYISMSYAAPAGALQYSEGIANLQIRPGAVGAAPLVSGVPGGTDIELRNEARTVARGRSTISVSLTGYGGQIVVRGQIPRTAGVVSRSVPVADPAQYTAAVFNELLKRKGIQATGGVRAAHTAAESPVTGRSVFAPALDASDRVRVLAIHNSPPLIDILSVINHKSHNLMAETALRTVGRVATGEGSAAAGARAVMHMLVESGTDTSADLTIVDGSGLSPLNRVSARAFVHMLSFMAKSPMFRNFWETLPEAGASNGLHRMYRTGAEGNLRAKTGTIDNVSALSGYVRTSDGEQMAFSILSNDVPSTYRAKRIEDAIGARIASFNRTGAIPEPVAEPALKTGKATASASKGRTTTKSSASSGRTYRIRKGDTLDGIARRNGTTVTKLKKVNPGLNPKRLIPGKSIKLPAK